MCKACDIDDDISFESGQKCPCKNCDGILEDGDVEGCSCHLSAPCSACMNAGYVCPVCKFDSAEGYKEARRQEDEFRAEEDAKLRAARKPWDQGGKDRSKETTGTRTANALNSTPFTNCCDTAAFGERCRPAMPGSPITMTG